MNVLTGKAIKNLTISSLLFILLYNSNVSAQQIFVDSGQQLGNSFSWNAALGDLDGDGDLDAVVANPSYSDDKPQKNEIWINDGNGNFSKSSQEIGSSYGLTLFDIDMDNDLDVIEGAATDTYSSSNQVWLNNGQGSFTLSDYYNFEHGLIAFYNHLSNDEKFRALNLTRSGYTIDDSTRLKIYLIENSACKLEKEIVFKNFSANGLAIGDLNNDNYSDLVLYRDKSNYILFNDKNGGFIKSDQELQGEYNTCSIILSDINEDSCLDILQCNYHSRVSGEIFHAKLYLNAGNNHFKNVHLPYNTAYLTPNAAIWDLDNDGDLDIFLNHGHQSTKVFHKSEILFNSGHSNFTCRTVNLEPIQSRSMAFGDLDNDGDLDIFFACADLKLSGKPNIVWINMTIDK